MRLEHGQIDLELGGETVTLSPTLDAMQKINRKFGSFRGAMEQIQRLDFDSIVFVVETAARRKGLAEAIFNAGVADVTATVSEYLVRLINPSGREAQDEGKA